MRSTLGEEKSTSDLGFIRSLAPAEIGRKTVDQQQGIDYLKQTFHRHHEDSDCGNGLKGACGECAVLSEETNFPSTLQRKNMLMLNYVLAMPNI
ncbi:hypothetical protein EYF80_027198 [Liparis tanakae]|uniref:Uncharacterized protein n=1 Tax=Liparis tanakae TaxID=230148 RepID=A0A4Z2H9V0_9TELE|nr:hypothetical protein EYF80_027198 [Liparis tanakae]